MNKFSYNRSRKAVSKCLKLCKQLQLKCNLLENRLNRIDLQDKIVNSLVDNSSNNQSEVITNKENIESLLQELSTKSNYIGYMTICSSVQTSGRKPEINQNSQQPVKKDALGGVTLDVDRLEKYLLRLGSLAHRQAKYEYSAESLSASSKEEFLNSLILFFNNHRNESCMVFYSGHGLRDTSLVFETAVENYHIMYEDFLIRWKARDNLKNKHLFILLDCCYSGSWVVELFRNGDFREVSIQASSSYDQTSNDLGADIGSLFTALLTKINGLENQANLQDIKVIKAMSSQTPMGFCSKRGVSQKIFKNIGFNSWSDLVSSYPFKIFNSTNGVQSLMKEIPAGNENDFQFVTVIISKDSLVLEGEWNMSDTNKRVCFLTVIKKIFTSNMIGSISIWNCNGLLQGIFFREFKSKRFEFGIPEESLKSSLSLVSQWLIKLEAFNSANAEFELIDDALRLLTKLNKNNLINNNHYGDEDEEIDFESMKSKSFNSLDTLNMSGKLDGQRVLRLFQFMSHKYSALKNIKLENINCEISDFEGKCLESISIEINEETPLETFTILTNKVVYFTRRLSVTFNEKAESKSLAFPLLYSNLPFSVNLMSLSLLNVNSVYFNDILSTVRNSLSLNSVSLINCDFEMTQSNKLIEVIFSRTEIRSVTLINSNLATMIHPHVHITYCNLSKNKLISANVKPIFKINFETRYTIDLSYNLINPNLLPELSVFLKNNKFCEEFNLAGNHLSTEILGLARMNLLYKNVIAVLNLCESDLSKCEIKSLSDLLNKAKQLRHLNIKRCQLTNNQLVEVMSILNSDSINSITSVDISYNKITNEDVFHSLRRKVKFSKSLKTLLMIDCVDISNASKPLLADGFFNGKDLTEINYSYWKANQGFDINTKIAESIKNISLREFSFCSSSTLNLESLEIEHLEIDSCVLHFIVLPKNCASLKVHDINNEFIPSVKPILNQVQSLSISSSDYLNKFVDDLLAHIGVAASSRSSYYNDIMGKNIPYQKLDVLVTEEIDQEASRFIKDIMTTYPISLNLTDNSSNLQLFRNSLGKVFFYLSDELLKILISRKIVDLYGADSIHSLTSNDDSLPSTLKCISLIGNCFNFKFLINARFDSIEVLEINSVFLKVALPSIEVFVSNNANLRVLIIKDSLMNQNEVYSLIKILSTLSTTIEELHLINNFIGLIGIKKLLATLQKCTKLTTLNLSGNNVRKESIFEFAASHATLSSIILRGCTFSKKEVIESLNILHVKPLKMLDLSSMRLNQTALKSYIQAPSKWDLIDKYQADMALELSYSTKYINFGCLDHMQILHLNQINFDTSSWLLCSSIQSVNSIPVVKLTHCLNEHSFMRNFYLLASNTKVNYLDLSGNLMSEVNTKLVVKFLKNQIETLLNKKVHISVSQTKLEDCNFELIYDYVCSMESHGAKPSVLIDISHNMLSSNSMTLINLLEKEKREIYGQNMQRSFMAEPIIEELKDKYYYMNLNEKEQDLTSIVNSDFGRSARSDKSIFLGHKNIVIALVKVSDDLFASGSYDSTIKLWKVSTTKCIKTLIGHKQCVRILVRMNDDLIASGSYDNTIKLWEVSSGICIKTLIGHENMVRGLEKIDDDLIVSGAYDNTIKLWEISTGACIKTMTGHEKGVFSIIKMNNDLIASGSADNAIKLWEISSGSCIQSLTTENGGGILILIKINDDLIASGYYDNTVKMWQVSTSSVTITLNGHSNWILTLAKMGDDVIVSGSYDNTIKIWELSTATCIKTLNGHENGVFGIIEMADGMLISASADSTIRRWETKDNDSPMYSLSSFSFKNSQTLIEHQKAIYAIIKISDDLIVSGSLDCSIKVWQISTATCIKTLTGHLKGVWSLVKMSDDIIASGSEDCSIKLWQVSTEACIKTLSGHKSTVRTLIKIGCDLIISGSYDGNIKLWQFSTAACIKTFVGHLNWVFALVKMSDDMFMSSSADNTIKLWQISTGTCIKTLTGHQSWVWTIIKLNDEKIISGSDDNTVKVWEVNTGTCIQTFTGHEKGLRTLLKISNDLIATGSADNTIMLWEVSTASRIKTITGHDNTVLTLLKMSDELLISGSEDSNIKIWTQTFEDQIIY